MPAPRQGRFAEAARIAADARPAFIAFDRADLVALVYRIDAAAETLRLSEAPVR